MRRSSRGRGRPQGARCAVSPLPRARAACACWRKDRRPTEPCSLCRTCQCDGLPHACARAFARCADDVCEDHFYGCHSKPRRIGDASSHCEPCRAARRQGDVNSVTSSWSSGVAAARHQVRLPAPRGAPVVRPFSHRPSSGARVRSVLGSPWRRTPIAGIVSMYSGVFGTSHRHQLLGRPQRPTCRD